MAIAWRSFTAAPRLSFVHERARLNSLPPALVHLSSQSLQSSSRSNFVRVQRAPSYFCPMWRFTNLNGLSRQRAATFATRASSITRVLGLCQLFSAARFEDKTNPFSRLDRFRRVPALNLQNLFPQSVLEKAPTLLGALVPVVFTVYLSHKLNLGLEKEILVAVFRCTAQLSTLGFVLKMVFDGQHIALSILFMMAMVIVAGQTSGERAKLLPQSRLVSTASLIAGAFGTIWLMVFMKVFPLEPKYLIPATGYLVGSSMSMVATTLSCIQHDVHLHELEIEAALALGATPHQAISKHLRTSLIRGLGPIFDNVKVAGLVTLPGALTGMLMSGSHPLEAVQFSLVLMYMLVGAASLSSVIAAQLGWRSLFSSSMQLLRPS